MTNHPYLSLKEQIASLANACGRNPKEITLIAVTKGHSLESISNVYNHGCRDFGENRLNEALLKMGEAPADLQWHFIGTLQSNKVKKAMGKFCLIHSVDSPALAAQINTQSQIENIQTDILLQVNTSGEATKHGLTVEGWQAYIEDLLQLRSIRLRGLMTIGPLTLEEESIRLSFATLREFRDRLNRQYQEDLFLEHLSMGMSADYALAIAEGATLLRIGKAIFSGSS